MSLFDDINNRAKGTFITVNTYRPCKVKKACIDLITKGTKMQLRVGHNYYSQATTKEAHESGQREIYTSEKLWHKKSEKGAAFREHKKNGKVYLAGQPSGNKATRQFFRNGNAVSFEDVENDLMSTEKKSNQSDHIMIDIDTILTVK
jgi:hypothetical protein